MTHAYGNKKYRVIVNPKYCSKPSLQRRPVQGFGELVAQQDCRIQELDSMTCAPQSMSLMKDLIKIYSFFSFLLYQGREGVSICMHVSSMLRHFVAGCIANNSFAGIMQVINDRAESLVTSMSLCFVCKHARPSPE